MQLPRYCTVALVSWLTAAGSGYAAQEAPPSPPAPQAPAQAQPSTEPASLAIAGENEFTIFLHGRRVGVEQVRVARAGSQWIISSTGQFGAPINVTVNRFELKYTADWQPAELHIEATQPGRIFALTTSFGVTTATNVITQNSQTTSKTDQITARTIVLPNNFYAGYVGLAARLLQTAPGTELPV